MHVAPNLHEALQHTNKLLAKNGHFLLQEFYSGKEFFLAFTIKARSKI